MLRAGCGDLLAFVAEEEVQLQEQALVQQEQLVVQQQPLLQQLQVVLHLLGQVHPGVHREQLKLHVLVLQLVQPLPAHLQLPIVLLQRLQPFEPFLLVAALLLLVLSFLLLSLHLLVASFQLLDLALPQLLRRHVAIDELLVNLQSLSSQLLLFYLELANAFFQIR